MYVERESCLSSVGKEEEEEEEEEWDYLTPLHNTRYRQELSEGKRGEEKSDATASQARGVQIHVTVSGVFFAWDKGEKCFSLGRKEGKRGRFFFCHVWIFLFRGKR